jgi:CheY-like chemotaxis protein
MLHWDNPSSWTVLLVEDEPDNLEVLVDAVEYHGMSALSAANGLEGLKVLEESVPTLILLDLSMPKMDGWDMHKQVKANPRTQHIPVVALTAHAMTGDKEKVLAAGFDGYLTKPISIASFLTDLRQAMDRAKLNHEVQ